MTTLAYGHSGSGKTHSCSPPRPRTRACPAVPSGWADRPPGWTPTCGSHGGQERPSRSRRWGAGPGVRPPGDVRSVHFKGARPARAGSGECPPTRLSQATTGGRRPSPTRLPGPADAPDARPHGRGRRGPARVGDVRRGRRVRSASPRERPALPLGGPGELQARPS